MLYMYVFQGEKTDSEVKIFQKNQMLDHFMVSLTTKMTPKLA